MRIFRISVFIFALKLILFSSTAYSGSAFKIINRTYGNVPAAFRTEIDTLFNNLETEVNKKLPDADQSSYLKGMANSGVMSSKGIGVHYPEFDWFVVGGALGLGADLGNSGFSDVMGGDVDSNQIRGFGAQVSAMAGLNLGIFPLPALGWFDFKKLRVFVNFLSMDVPDIDNLDGKVSNYGIHFQYPLMDPAEAAWGILKWEGVKLSTGLEFSNLDIKFTQTYNTSQAKTLTTLGNPTVTANFTGTAIAGADVEVKSIPIEVSTAGRLLYFLTTYIGLAADLNFGEAKSTASLTGPITVTETGSSIGAVSATANLDLGSSADPTTINGRAFLGLQFNITIVKIFAQLQRAIGADTWGMGVGARIAW